MNIQPNNQTVEKSLKQRTYYIDFYQREYVWDSDTVKTLLDDIFFAFDLTYEQHKDKDLNAETIAKYNWYYLNVYITNLIDGKEYIVDGQQRLSTLTLIATKLLHLAQLNKDKFEHIIPSLQDCIFGTDKYKGKIFWIDNEKRKNVMHHITTNPKSTYTNEILNKTEETILDRFKEIETYFDKKNLSEHKLMAFIAFFLERLVLVELKIEKNDTPMVFEVINDRGVALKPFEILKGKLIGSLDKADTETYSDLWENSINNLREIEDLFFSDYLKSQFIFERNADIEKLINHEYHRYIFSNNNIANNLQFRMTDNNHLENIKKFIQSDLIYYSSLYAKIKTNNLDALRFNNTINDLSGQYQNILSACNLNDPEESQKIELIAKEIDRLYILLRLNGVYNSNNFIKLQYKLNKLLKSQPIDGYREVFNNLLIEQIKEGRNIETVNSLLDFDKFSLRSYEDMDKTPIRYILARIEQYICDNIGINMTNDVQSVTNKISHKIGYHIEHILARNDENKGYFETEEDFEIRRNKLGGLLLLHNMDNIISSNEDYFSGKIKTYLNNEFIWNKTLAEDFYHKTNARFHIFNEEFEKRNNIKFEPISTFNNEALEYRSKLMYHIIKEIWNID